MASNNSIKKSGWQSDATAYADGLPDPIAPQVNVTTTTTNLNALPKNLALPRRYPDPGTPHP